MLDMLAYKANLCPTAAALLIHQHKVLLVHHKKLNIWLAPGGHTEDGEQAFETAERECFEETGIKVQAYSPLPLIDSTSSQYLPVPIVSNIHWVSKSNYLTRINSKFPHKLHKTKLWPRGCEQHFGVVYLVRPIGALELHYDPNESLGIGWFTPEELGKIDVFEDVRQEVSIAMSLLKEI